MQKKRDTCIINKILGKIGLIKYLTSFYRFAKNYVNQKLYGWKKELEAFGIAR